MRALCIRFFALLFAVTIVLTTASPHAWAATPAPVAAPKIMISEFQPGGLTAAGVEDGKMEFVELYNPGESPLYITGWQLEYLSASHTGAGPPTRVLATFEGTVYPADYLLVSYDGYIADADVYFGTASTASSGLLAKSGGHIRVVDSTGIVVDLVGWGTGVSIEDWSHVPEVSPGSSVQRILPGDPRYTTAQAYDQPSTTSTPRGGGLRAPDPLP